MPTTALIATPTIVPVPAIVTEVTVGLVAFTPAADADQVSADLAAITPEPASAISAWVAYVAPITGVPEVMNDIVPTRLNQRLLI